MSEMSLGLNAMAAAERPVEVRRHFFDVSVVKLVVMSIVTFGIYEVYWFYKQWEAQQEKGMDVRPLARAIFAVLFAHALFKETEEIGRGLSVEVETKPSTYAWLFFLLQLLWQLPDPFWLLGFATVLPLIPMQRDVRRIHAALGLDPTVNDHLTWQNVVGIVFGVLFFLLVIIGYVLPEA